MTRKLEALQYHRNGVCGEGFYALTFTDAGQRMVAVVFYNPEEPPPFSPRVAVFDRDMLAAGNVTFGENSWRGDHYSEWCYEMIRATRRDMVSV